MNIFQTYVDTNSQQNATSNVQHVANTQRQYVNYSGEIAEFDTTNELSLSVEQFVERVDREVFTYCGVQ
ncbi:hypothetical protein CVS40_11686 [Lucilia cuprina]|nr:hypothetical protein CVS40_11686 [Lucilia cuprina]